jgi:hypothetical protein
MTECHEDVKDVELAFDEAKKTIKNAFTGALLCGLVDGTSDLDSGEPMFVNDFVSLPLFDKKHKIVARTLISADRYPQVQQHSIHLARIGRLFEAKIRNGQALAHFVTKKPAKGKVKDHINRIRLDNRTQNLRDATPGQNAQNRSRNKKTSSKYFGVTRIRQRTGSVSWESGIHGPGNKRIRKKFKDELSAGKFYDSAAIHFYGLHARTNNLLTPQEQQLALITSPSPPARNLPRNVCKDGSKFVTLISLGKGSKCFGRFSTVEEAAERALLVRAAHAEELEREHTPTSITVDESGQAFITLNSTLPAERHLRVKVDNELWRVIAQWHWNWQEDEQTYPHGHVEEKTLLLHRFVWRLLHPNDVVTETQAIDHINNDVLDVRAENLQKITKSENILKARKRKSANVSSKYVGVSHNERGWRARFNFQGREKHLGYFESEEEARDARASAVRRVCPALKT